MTRKDPHRKDKIIEAALRLFAEYGYERTTIDMIRKEVGISKGAFYHHFKGKQDLLDTVIETITHNSVQEAMEALNNPELSPKEKLIAFLLGGRSWRMRHMKLLIETVGLLFNPENALLFRKVFVRNVEVTKPLMHQILEEAMEKGELDIEDPSVTADILLFFFTTLAMYYFKAYHKMREERREPMEVAQALVHRINVSIGMVERMLGLPKSAITRMGDEELSTIAKWIDKGAGNA